jgi:hypothetical protein
LAAAETGEPGVELLEGEVPDERRGDLVVGMMQCGQTLLDLVAVVKIGWGCNDVG